MIKGSILNYISLSLFIWCEWVQQGVWWDDDRFIKGIGIKESRFLKSQN